MDTKFEYQEDKWLDQVFDGFEYDELDFQQVITLINQFIMLRNKK